MRLLASSSRFGTAAFVPLILREGRGLPPTLVGIVLTAISVLVLRQAPPGRTGATVAVAVGRGLPVEARLAG